MKTGELSQTPYIDTNIPRDVGCCHDQCGARSGFFFFYDIIYFNIIYTVELYNDKVIDNIDRVIEINIVIK